MRLPVCPRTTIERLREVDGESEIGVDIVDGSMVSRGAGREDGVGLGMQDKHVAKGKAPASWYSLCAPNLQLSEHGDDYTPDIGGNFHK